MTRIREEIYDMNTLPVFETLRLDLRDAVRQLRRRPLVTVLALLLLTIGISASAAAFSVAYGVLVRPLPYPDPDRIAVLWAETDGRRAQISLPDFDDLRAAVPFADSAALASGRVTVTGGAEADRVILVQAEAGLLRVLGTRAAMGRLPVEADEGQSIAVISNRLWRTTFGGDPNIVGRPIGLNGLRHTIVGVFDPAFGFELTVPDGSGAVGSGFTIKDVDVWTPFNLVPGVTLSREVSTCEAVVRLKPGQTLSTTQAALEVAARSLARAYPGTNRDRRFVLTRLADQMVEGRSAVVAMGLAGALLLLVIACANVASLFLGELQERRRDFALRAALGAGRARLIRQLVIESALLGGTASVIGLAASRSMVDWLKHAADLPRVDAIRFDLPITVAIVSAAMAAATISRLAPLAGMRPSHNDLRASASAYAASAPALRRSLVIVQLSLALMFSSTAALLALSLHGLVSVDPGFEPSHTLAARVSAYASRYPDKPATARFVNELVRRIAALPGVQAAAAGQSIPLTASAAGTSVAVEGQVVPMADRPTASWFTVTPGYFHALGIPLGAGRDFVAADLNRPSHQTVINEVLARQLFGAENPIGRRVSFGPEGSDADWHEVVGVVGDVRQSTLAIAPGPAAYDLFGQHWGRSVYLVARGTADPYTLTPAIRSIVRQLDPEAPVFDVRSLDDVVLGAVAPRRLATGFAIGVAVISLFLAAIGLYGLLASSVASRTKELGIRRALGASTRGIVALVFTEAAALGAAGTAAGAAASLLVARAIQSQLFGVRAADVRVIAAVAALLAAVGAAAAFFPARRAARVDLAVALRDE